MTDDYTDFEKPDLETRLQYVLSRNDIPTENIQLVEMKPSPSDETRYKIELREPDSYGLAWVGPSYTEEQLRTYLHGIEHATEIMWQVQHND